MHPLIDKNQMKIILTFLSLNHAHNREERLEDESVQVALYKYLSQIKYLSTYKEFEDLNILKEHLQLKSFLFDPSFDNSQQAIKNFAQLLKDNDAQYLEKQ